MATSVNKAIRPMVSGIMNGFRASLVRSKATKVSAATAEDMSVSMGVASETIFRREDKYGAHNYHPLPVALCRGQGESNANLGSCLQIVERPKFSSRC